MDQIPGVSQPMTPPAPLSPADERTWAMLAHLSVLVNLVTGFLGPVVALIIYLVYKDRSRFVAFQSLQSVIFQLIAWIGSGIIAVVLWTIGGVLSVVCIGILIFPLAMLFSLIPLAAVVYGVVAGIQINQGVDFRYWLVGEWAEKYLMG